MQANVGLSHDPHPPSRQDPHWLEHHSLSHAIDRTPFSGSKGIGGDGSHLGRGLVREGLDIIYLGGIAGGRTGGLEGGVELRFEDLDNVGGCIGDGGDVVSIDGAGVDSIADREAGGRVHVGELVGKEEGSHIDAICQEDASLWLVIRGIVDEAVLRTRQWSSSTRQC